MTLSSALFVCGYYGMNDFETNRGREKESDNRNTEEPFQFIVDLMNFAIIYLPHNIKINYHAHHTYHRHHVALFFFLHYLMFFIFISVFNFVFSFY